MKPTKTLSSRQWRIINCLIGAYPDGRVCVRDLAMIMRCAEPRISEDVSRLETDGLVVTERHGKARLIQLAQHPALYYVQRPAI